MSCGYRAHALCVTSAGMSSIASLVVEQVETAKNGIERVRVYVYFQIYGEGIQFKLC